LFLVGPFAVVVMALLMVTSARLASNIQRVSAHDSAPGRVVDIKYSIDRDAEPVVTSYYQYDVRGQGYMLQGPTSDARGWTPPVGTTRSILYNPDDPSDAVVRDLGALVVVPVIQAGLVAVLALIGAMAVRRAEWRRLRIRR
jgi:hypothetical protein